MIADPPRPPKAGSMGIRRSDELRLRARSLYLGLLKPPMLRRRHFDGVLATMPQSGTNWTMYLLSLTLAKLYDLPLPSYVQDRSILTSPGHSQIPRIFHTFRVPHYLLRSRTLFRLLHFPKHLILVRDLRAALVSNYEKRKDEYGVDFSTYLRGDARGKLYRHDIWMRIQFLNGWGAVVERHPEQAAVLKYEDLKANTRGQLAWVCDHFNIKGATPDLLDEVVGAASKAEMAKRLKPGKTKNPVRMDPRPADECYSDADLRFVAEVLRRNLKYTFGYQYW